MTHKKKIVFYLISIFLTFVLAIALFVMPIIKDILSQSEIIVMQRNKLASMEEMVDSFGGVEKNYAYYDKKLEDMKKLLHNEGNIDTEIPIEFINFFREQAKQYKLSLNINPLEKDSAENSFWEFLDFRIKGSGEYEDFMKFLQKLEYSNWFIEIRSLSLNKEKSLPNLEEDISTQKRLIAFDSLIRVYVQKEN